MNYQRSNILSGIADAIIFTKAFYKSPEISQKNKFLRSFEKKVNFKNYIYIRHAFA